MMKESTQSELGTLSNDVKKKQKSARNFGVLSFTFLISIPICIHLLNRFQIELWKISLVVAAMGFVAFFFHRSQQGLKRDIEAACYRLGVGARLIRKYKKTAAADLYQIFQEGHRYYYLENTSTGEKRLVAKEKVLQDFELAL